MEPKPPVTTDEERQKKLDALGKAIARAKMIQDVEKMPAPAPESERPTRDDPPVWVKKEDGTVEQEA